LWLDAVEITCCSIKFTCVLLNSPIFLLNSPQLEPCIVFDSKAKFLLDAWWEQTLNNNNDKHSYAGTNDCFTHLRVLLVLQVPRHFGPIQLASLMGGVALHWTNPLTCCTSIEAHFIVTVCKEWQYLATYTNQEPGYLVSWLRGINPSCCPAWRRFAIDHPSYGHLLLPFFLFSETWVVLFMIDIFLFILSAADLIFKRESVVRNY
jgi:hypothetical protein